ncbi:MAG TPA: hypothetical protein PLQ76_07230, partial [bacterium]|nr:hypothetical protein [bacterium]
MNENNSQINSHLFNRAEYPRPDWFRRDFISLDGDWEFCEDHSDKGEKEKWHDGRRLPETIKVPYCVESKASGINRKYPA